MNPVRKDHLLHIEFLKLCELDIVKYLPPLLLEPLTLPIQHVDQLKYIYG